MHVLQFLLIPQIVVRYFDERYLWYKHTKKVEQKWGTPIYIQLAIIKMESDFDWLQNLQDKKFLK